MGFSLLHLPPVAVTTRRVLFSVQRQLTMLRVSMPRQHSSALLQWEPPHWYRRPRASWMSCSRVHTPPLADLQQRDAGSETPGGHRCDPVKRSTHRPLADPSSSSVRREATRSSAGATAGAGKVVRNSCSRRLDSAACRETAAVVTRGEEPELKLLLLVSSGPVRFCSLRLRWGCQCSHVSTAAQLHHNNKVKCAALTKPNRN